MNIAMLADEALNLTNMSFGQAFAWYAVKFVVYAFVAFAGIKIGIALRKRKNSSVEEQSNAQ